ncbi:hypothetical protein ACIBK1_22550 [Microbispora rosea]|uniref:hypothetical protein n=1 Tax=Microbispora rosea TaxID=58117 RepID=UPI000AA82AD5|nr:hypothetical protein [Microbispora rosea]
MNFRIAAPAPLTGDGGKPLTREPWIPTWYAALPIAGEAERMVGGTPRGRMGGTAATGP